MLTVEQALARVLEGITRGGAEPVPIADALGRVLAEALVATMDLPPWDNSAMDGYAVRACDTPGRLLVTESVAAGRMSSAAIDSRQAARIFTGAPLPPGTDSVVMQEDTSRDGDVVVIASAVHAGQHVRPRGQDVRTGTTLLNPGVVITPGVLGLLATFGRCEVAVTRRPRVALISTGDEVVLPGQPLGLAQIYSSNNAALAGMVAQAGAIPVDLGNVHDDPEAIRQRFADAARLADVLVSTGGVSVGDHDHVKGVLGDQIGFWQVAMKPGKPLAFGKIQGKAFFGLPGNPVSCLVNFLQFVRPMLRTMLGDPRPYLPVVHAQLARPVRRHTGRVELLRVRLHRQGDELIATPAGGHQGSGNVRSMAESHGFAMLDATTSEVSGVVSVQVFDGSFEARSEPGYSWGAAVGEAGGECC